MELKLEYLSPAEDSDQGWEQQSLPLGNGYLGANVFGIVDRERIQITENSLLNPRPQGGLNNLAELYFRFPHAAEKDYRRSLDLNRAVSVVRYVYDNITYTRTCFASYPDRALVIRFETDRPGALSFVAAPVIPYLTDEEARKKTGTVTACGNTLTLSGRMAGYAIRFEGQLRIETDGELYTADETIAVEHASTATMIFVCGTNYVLEPRVFLEPDPHKKLTDKDPHETVTERMAAAASYSYAQLLERHIRDYTSLFGRVSFELENGGYTGAPTDRLLSEYAAGNRSHYLETLYFQYGRYLLISSSRKGALPANLQGVWNVHDRAPWGCGYWHNINVQMNYWPAYVTNLGETFASYEDFFLAFQPEARNCAVRFMKEQLPELYEEGRDYGWAIGTAVFPYSASKPDLCSGTGAGALASKMFWDAYAFTCDRKKLRKVTYPILLSLARFLCSCVKDEQGKFLSAFSISPEQMCPAPELGPDKHKYYQTAGSSFDQQMIWENAHDLLRCVELLGEDTLPEEDRAVIAEVREQIGRYDPVLVGWSGQIREFREETFYGVIGEYHHRHISHLIGLFPGTSISSDTPAWLDAAKVSLDRRSDESTGWALAHRLCAWARTGDGNRAYRLLSNLIGLRTMPNLWDRHPPFQIDGNFGGTTGIAEMFLQSHESSISLFPSLPDDWPGGSFSGLVARGNFEVSARWDSGSPTEISVLSRSGGTCRLKLTGLGRAVPDFAGAVVEDADHVSFETQAGMTYRFTEIPPRKKTPVPYGFRVSPSLELNWDSGVPVTIWRAYDSAPCYELVASPVEGNSFTDPDCAFDSHETVTYKLTAAGEPSGSAGPTVTMNHATQDERKRYHASVVQPNVPDAIFVPGDWD